MTEAQAALLDNDHQALHKLDVTKAKQENAKRRLAICVDFSKYFSLKLLDFIGGSKTRLSANVPTD